MKKSAFTAIIDAFAATVGHIADNWKNYLCIAACFAFLVALNAFTLHITHGYYNMVTILFA